MTHLYQITYTRLSPRRTTFRRSRRLVAPDLPEAIRRLYAKEEQIHPGAIVTVEHAQVYNHDTQQWERVT